MIAPLGVGDLDVGGGGPSAGLYNAAERKVNVKVVADKGSMPPGYGYFSMLVRKDLVTSGKVKTIADFKGLKVGDAIEFDFVKTPQGEFALTRIVPTAPGGAWKPG